MKNTIELVERLEDATGEWRAHPSGAEYLIRAVPAPELKRIRRKSMGKEITFTHTKAGRQTTYDQDKTEQGLVEKACLALVDSRPDASVAEANRFTGFRIAGDALAQKFSRALGRTVKAGELVQLHGAWSLEAKELVFGLSVGLRDWVLEESEKLESAEAEDESGKDGR